MAADPKLASVGSLSDDPVVLEARERFDRCAEWEASWRERFLNDLKFRHGDSDNNYQWPNSIKRARDVDQKPCLTINNIRQHNLMIVNDARQNKQSISVVPTGNGATKDAADCYLQLIRRIEYQSDAQTAYTCAMNFQVDGGIGWWRIVTDYADSDSFDQEIFIRRVADPLSVYMDPDCQEENCSDAKFAFVFDSMPRDEFEEAYPKYANLGDHAPLGISSVGDRWTPKDEVLICEYFRLVPKKDQVIEFEHPQTGERRTIRKSKLHSSFAKKVIDHPQSRVREVWDQVVEWRLIVGEKEIDSTAWMGRYIPLIRVIGEETVIGGQLDRKGHTRAMKDAQRMYNYNASSQVEQVALQGKTPWIAPSKAIEEFESMWNSANLVNHSVLPWNHRDDDGNDIPPPFRTQPPAASPAYQAGMETAFNQLMMASGQWQNQMGMMGNERTGEAIKRRQHQSDTAVFHFQDNFASALRWTGVQLLDLIPKVYDTRRVLMAMAEDGAPFEVTVDPSARQSYLQEQAHNGDVVKRIFNPTVGKYGIEASVGPAYGTRRAETVEAMTLLLTQAPALTGLIGDLLLKAMDFKEAQEASQRLRRMVPPQALGQGPTQQEQAQQAQIQQLQTMLAKALEKHGKDQLKLVGKDQMRDIDVYKAQTDRFKAFASAFGLDENAVKGALDELVGEAMDTHLGPIIKANAKGVQNQAGGDTSPDETPPVENARRAPDGEWYLADPTRRGKWMRVGALARQGR